MSEQELRARLAHLAGILLDAAENTHVGSPTSAIKLRDICVKISRELADRSWPTAVDGKVVLP